MVGIVIDQMRYDYVYRFWDQNNGFKKLIKEGTFRNCQFGYVPLGPGISLQEQLHHGNCQ